MFHVSYIALRYDFHDMEQGEYWYVLQTLNH
jgi:hypothetical protein